MCGSYSNNSERSYTYKVYWYIALCTIIVALVLMECYYWVAWLKQIMRIFFSLPRNNILVPKFFLLFPNVFVQAVKYFSFKKSVFQTQRKLSLSKRYIFHNFLLLQILVKKIAMAICSTGDFLDFSCTFFKPCCVHCRSKLLVKILAQTQNVAKTQTILTFVSIKITKYTCYCAISILIKVSHFYTKTHEKTLQLNFLLLIT